MHLQLLQQYPALKYGLCERSLSQDCVELVFSVLQYYAGGYKPNAATAAGVMQLVQLLHAYRLQHRSFLAASRKAVYHYHQLSTAKDYSWNSGVLLQSLAKMTAALGKYHQRTLQQLPTAQASVRQYHKRDGC
jgi:hypothetical protein